MNFASPKTQYEIFCRVAGVSFRQENVAIISEGDDVELHPDPENAKDDQAVKVFVRGNQIGFVPAYLAPKINWLLQKRKIKKTSVEGLGRPPGSPYTGVTLKIEIYPPGEDD